MAISRITSASIEDDAIAQADIGTIQSVGESAPSSPFIGQRWYRASTAITYQYTNDGTSSFWLDISSGGIGTSADRGIDFVGDIDPHKATNGTGLAVGSVYYNREKNRHFVCTDATSNANVWSGVYAGGGGVTSDYLLSGTYYRVHTFLRSGTFSVEREGGTFDILIIAGGGGGGNGADGEGEGGGGGAGGVKWYPAKTLALGSYSVTVGAGGHAGYGNADRGTNGTNSVFDTLTATGGGAGGTRNGGVQSGMTGGSGGGGGQRDNSTANAGAGTTNQGNNGGSGFEGAQMSGGGGGGAAAAGTSSPSTGVGGAGGAGIVEGTTALHNWTTGSGTTVVAVNGTAGSYAGGGGGGGQSTPANGQHGGGNGATAFNGGTNGTANTGGGGGGQGGFGGSGVVIVRYALN